jgi:hypothetical protein
VFVGHRFCLDDGGLDFGECCYFISRFKSPENGVDDALSSWKTDVQLWIEKKESLFVILLAHQ